MVMLFVIWLAWQRSEVTAEPSSLSTEANSSYLTTGDTVLIKCRITNTSLLSVINKYSIYWWKDDVKLTESSSMLSHDVEDMRYSVRIDTEGDTVFSILQITNITNEDEGTFVCELKGSEISIQNQAVIIKVNNLLGTLEDFNTTTTTPINLSNSSFANLTQELTQLIEESTQSLPNTTTHSLPRSTSAAEKITMIMKDDTTLADSTTISTWGHTQSSEKTTNVDLTAKAPDDLPIYEENTTVKTTKTTVKDENISETSELSSNIIAVMIGGTVSLIIIIIVIASITWFTRKLKRRGRRELTRDDHQYELVVLPEKQNLRASYEAANDTRFLRTFETPQMMRNSVSSESFDRSCTGARMTKTIEPELLHRGPSVDANELPFVLTENNECMHSLSNFVESDGPSFARAETTPKRKRKCGYESWRNTNFLKEYTKK